MLAAGNSRADVLSPRFLSHPSRDLSTPGSVSQAGRALSVTDPLDSSDKDEDDIWTPRGRGGREEDDEQEEDN